MKNQIRHRLLFFCILILIVFSTKLSAQDLIEKQVLQLGILLTLDGYEITHDIKYGSLYNNRNGNYYFNLNKGWSYKIYAVCDEDCGDIDLCLYDESENEIDCDMTSDDKPIVSATPKWTGRFRLEVTMYDCRLNPCQFGIAVFGK